MFGLHNRYEQANLLSKNKPASIENIRRAATLHKKTKRFQLIIYTFLERPSGWLAGIYQLIIFATVLICLILSVLVTIPQYDVVASNILMQAEMVIVVWLSLELALRVWSSGCRSRYQTWKGRLKFMRNPFCILDLTVIIASISLTVVATSQNKHKNFAAAAFRGLRFFQILRMLRVDRRAGTWRLLGTVVWAHRQVSAKRQSMLLYVTAFSVLNISTIIILFQFIKELITTFYIELLILLVSSFIMYMLEKDAPNSMIVTFADSLWWGVITLCTVGYGDTHPVTWGGKILACFNALIGISFFALPAGILGSGFALKVQAMQRQKHLNRRRAPAATLIQCLWRCYAADAKSGSKATWKMHQKALAANQAAFLSNIPQIPEYSIAQLAKPYAGANSFLHRVASLKRRPSPTETSLRQQQASFLQNNQHMFQSSFKPTNMNNEFFSSTLASSRRDAIVIPELFNAQSTNVFASSFQASESDVPQSPLLQRMQSQDSAANMPMMLDESLINELSQSNNRSASSFIMALATVSSRNQNSEAASKITPVKSSFAHRTLNFLSELNTVKGDFDDTASDHHSNSHSSKPQLTKQHKNVIRVIRKIMYFVSRRKFREALRPYDVTDVIEQYSAGNLDMLARIKTLQFRLDKVLGSSKSKDCYDSSNISLASRIVKVEAQMENVDLKITQFLNNYSMDMQILMSKVDQQKNSTNNNNSRNKQFREEIPTKMSYNLNKMDYFVHNHVDLEEIFRRENLMLSNSACESAKLSEKSRVYANSRGRNNRSLIQQNSDAYKNALIEDDDEECECQHADHHYDSDDTLYDQSNYCQNTQKKFKSSHLSSDSKLDITSSRRKLFAKNKKEAAARAAAAVAVAAVDVKMRKNVQSSMHHEIDLIGNNEATTNLKQMIDSHKCTSDSELDVNSALRKKPMVTAILSSMSAAKNEQPNESSTNTNTSSKNGQESSTMVNVDGATTKYDTTTYCDVNETASGNNSTKARKVASPNDNSTLSSQRASDIEKPEFKIVYHKSGDISSIQCEKAVTLDQPPKPRVKASSTEMLDPVNSKQQKQKNP